MTRKVIYPTKIICPSTAEIIHRSRLFDIIDEARQQTKIIWIAAPGGSGKTTLLSSYLERNKVAHCWYQIDEEDRDLATFFHYLGWSGRLAAPRRKKAVPKLTPEYQQGIPAFTRHFFSDLSSRLQGEGLIVLDNFQLLSETDPVSSLLPCIADSLAAGISLVVLSRHLPPSSMHSLISKRQLRVIDTKLMRFEKEEWISASHLFNTIHSKDTLLSLHHKLDGWIAGLALLPDSPNVFDHTNTSGLGIEILDSYIAEQFLSSLTAETSDLLMKVCYLPHITATAAEAISHISDSKKLLAGLAQRNLFVLQQGDKGYTLHPLVREYLKQRAEDTLSKQQLYDLRLATAMALLAENESEAAADLLLELEAWQALMQAILNCATELHDSGRIKSLQRYIYALPKIFSQNEPWIKFWKGKLSVYNNAIHALDYYDIAYAGFIQKSNAVGVYTTWHSAVSVIYSTLQGCDRLIIWLNRYNEFSLRYSEPPPGLQKGYIEAILIQSYFLSGLFPQKRESLQAHLATAIDEISDPLLRLHMMSNYVHVALFSGFRNRDKIIIAKFESHLDDVKDNPLLYLGALTVCSLSAWSFNDFAKVLSLELRALEVAKESGISIFDGHIYAKIVVAALGLKKIDQAKYYLDIMKENISEKDQIYQSLYLTSMLAAGIAKIEPNDLDNTISHYLNSLEDTYCPPFILHNKLFYIHYLCIQKKTEAALALHNEVLQQAEKLAFPAQLSRFYMIYAKVYFNNGEFVRCNHYLEKSFAIAKYNEFIAYSNWDPRLMVWACQRALLLEIETSYVKHFVEMHYDNLPKPDVYCQRWPWPIRIHTFGGFELRTKNGLLHQRNRAEKSFSLLKVLVKAQDRHLSSEAIKRSLYPEEDHEKTSQLLDTQIHRLRKRLGTEQAILRQGDSIQLNFKYFWIDVLELETLGKQKVTEENALQVATQLQQLYRGEYLPNDDTLEVMAQRERYRSMYLAILFKCIEHLRGKPDIAKNICQNALVLEPLSEPLYRKLILVYLSQGNRDMAEVTLKQCRMMIERHLDIHISSETTSLLKAAIETSE